MFYRELNQQRFQFFQFKNPLLQSSLGLWYQRNFRTRLGCAAHDFSQVTTIFRLILPAGN
jgi:hypothetical protein